MKCRVEQINRPDLWCELNVKILSGGMFSLVCWLNLIQYSVRFQLVVMPPLCKDDFSCLGLSVV